MQILLCRYVGRHISIYIYRYIYTWYIYSWTNSWCQFKSDCHQTSSVIPLATGDEVIKLRSKVKFGGGVMRSTEHPSSSSEFGCGCFDNLVQSVDVFVLSEFWMEEDITSSSIFLAILPFSNKFTLELFVSRQCSIWWSLYSVWTKEP